MLKLSGGLPLKVNLPNVNQNETLEQKINSLKEKPLPHIL